MEKKHVFYQHMPLDKQIKKMYNLIYILRIFYAYKGESYMKTVTDFFGTMVFNDQVMKERLPEDVYNSIQNTIQNGKHLDLSLANEIANAMKDWAIGSSR